MATKKPSVTVTLPVHNALPYLNEAIESILNQTHGDFEFLIGDDCSTDDSLAVAQSYAERDKRIRIIKNDRNRGVTHTRLNLMKEAQGELIVLMDGDDVALSTRLARQVEFMNSRSDCGVVSSPVWTDNHPRSQILDYWNRELGEYDFYTKWRLCFNTDNPIINPAVMVRRAVLRHFADDFDTSLPAAGDYLMWLKLAPHTKFGYIEEPLLYWRQDHGSRISVANFPEQTSIALKLQLNHLQSLGVDWLNELHLLALYRPWCFSAGRELAETLRVGVVRYIKFLLSQKSFYQYSEIPRQYRIATIEKYDWFLVSVCGMNKWGALFGILRDMRSEPGAVLRWLGWRVSAKIPGAFRRLGRFVGLS